MTASDDRIPDLRPKGFACEHCPDEDPFDGEEDLAEHGALVHGDVPEAPSTEELADGEPPDAAAALLAAAGDDDERLAQVDLLTQPGQGEKGELINTSWQAVLKRSMDAGLPYDPTTNLRVVKLRGKICVRATAGNDAVAGREKRLDYFHIEYGWVRNGLIVERGRVSNDEDGNVLVI